MDNNKLKEYLENTPIEQLKKDWEEVKEWGKVEPKAEEFVGLFTTPPSTPSKGCCGVCKRWLFRRQESDISYGACAFISRETEEDFYCGSFMMEE